MQAFRKKRRILFQHLLGHIQKNSNKLGTSAQSYTYGTFASVLFMDSKLYRVTQKKGTFENPNKNLRNPRKKIY